MGFAVQEEETIDQRIAGRLKSLRAGRGWSLDHLAGLSSVSRATLSRLENAEVSATASVLGKLCAAYQLPLSRLMLMVEDDHAPLIRSANQPLWTDPETGFRRRSVSPPARGLAGEVLSCELDPATEITYDDPPKPGLEHHLVMTEGRLAMTVSGRTHDLFAGDCLRYQLSGPTSFKTSEDHGAKYLLFLV